MIDQSNEADKQQFFKRQKLFEALTASESWKELQQILLAQHATQLQLILEPPDRTVDGLAMSLMDHYRKGVVYGIQMTLKTPYATIETAKDIQRELTQRTKKETANGPEQFTDDGEQLSDTTRVTDLSGGDL